MNRRKSPAKSGRSRPQGAFRIIAGSARGRRLHFPAIDGLRPTPDRVRETLFNWLEPGIRGNRCLDLYSGSGALGLEALSRGAAHCLFVDSARPPLDAISEHLQTLGFSGDVRQAQLPQALQGFEGAFDLVFVDPPYAQRSQLECVEMLLANKLLAASARVYVESGATEPLPELPQAFTLHRHKKAGAVQYALYDYQPSPGE